MLAEYGVESVEELPINFDGIAMQLDEDFGNQVWDEHYGELEEQFARQTRLGGLVALLNPFQAIDHVSMALAGTDLAHDLAFQKQAEDYRRQLLRALNDEHAYGGSRTGERGWVADAEFYAGLDPFLYRSPDAVEGTRHRGLELLGLIVWGLLLMVALARGAASLERGRLPC